MSTLKRTGAWGKSWSHQIYVYNLNPLPSHSIWCAFACQALNQFFPQEVNFLSIKKEFFKRLLKLHCTFVAASNFWANLARTVSYITPYYNPSPRLEPTWPELSVLSLHTTNNILSWSLASQDCQFYLSFRSTNYLLDWSLPCQDYQFYHPVLQTIS
jgi:hypothetical protein